MTDELELLLEEEERKEEDTVFEFSAVGSVFSGIKKQAGLAEDSGNGTAAEREVADGETVDTVGRTGFGETALLIGAASREHRPEKVARWFYRRLSRAKQAAEYRRPAASGGVRLVKAEAGQRQDAGLTAGSIDREFQRDARRYDGGFTWQ